MPEVDVILRKTDLSPEEVVIFMGYFRHYDYVDPNLAGVMYEYMSGRMELRLNETGETIWESK